MESRDVMMLDEGERKALDYSYEPGLSERRVRNIVINFFLVLTALVLLFAYGIGVMWMAGVAGAILVVSAIEKVSYARAMLSYKSLVRKLVARVEELEKAGQSELSSPPAPLEQPSRFDGDPRQAHVG
ncbi:MAG TPA: hypothetical protein VNN80_08935 [Polyangiaceae bacterium]|jgi:hypothetical protein|nr:hypothetical protein [Polyangiaceae bacterium]